MSDFSYQEPQLNVEVRYFGRNKQYVTKSDPKYIYRSYYRAVRPESINFRHKMINDFNQNLCGGWFSGSLSPFEPIYRVLAGLKPLGVMSFKSSPQTDQEVRRCIQLAPDSMIYSLVDHPHNVGWKLFTLSQSGPLVNFFSEIGILILVSDYNKRGLSAEASALYRDIVHGNVSFDDFHEGHFDYSAGHSLSLVGLVLGYPIENTISLLQKTKINEKMSQKNRNNSTKKVSLSVK